MLKSKHSLHSKASENFDEGKPTFRHHADMETVADRIRYLRKQVFKETQQKLAASIGVERAAVTLWEKGGKIKDENAAKLVERAGTTRDWLRAGRGENPTREDYLLRAGLNERAASSDAIDWRPVEAAVEGALVAIAWMQENSAKELAGIILSIAKGRPYDSLDEDMTDKIRTEAMNATSQFLTQLRGRKHQQEHPS